MPSLFQRYALRLINLYPPFLGAGIRTRRIADGFETSMRLRAYNRNYVGTHFGGSLYSMCDPFFMLYLMEKLGRGYIVWDKAATIRFRRPGRGRVRARFVIPPGRVEEIRRAADADGKTEPVFQAEVLDEAGEVVASVEKVLSVRRKDRPAQP